MENSERHGGFLWIISMFAAAVSCIALVLSLLGASRQTQNEISATTKEAPVVIDVQNQSKYRATIENGYVVVRGEDGGVVATLDCPLRLMSDIDREYSKDGVDIFSDEELAALCEDFGAG